MNTDIIKAIYPPDEGQDYFSTQHDYEPLLRSFGEVLLQVDDDDYQGDSRVILKKDGNYGLLIFGWGSCSGCDALQACDSYEALEELRQGLENQIRWESLEALVIYLRTHDWEGDFSHRDEGTKDFVQKAIELLEKVVTQKEPCNCDACKSGEGH